MTPAEFRSRRRSLGLTQERLAQILDVAGNTVARWERGERPIHSPALVRLALERLEAPPVVDAGASPSMRDEAGTTSAHQSHGYAVGSAAARARLPAIGQDHRGEMVTARSGPAVSSNNLPVELSSFIGREREVAELVTLMSTSRLLTLVGAGGIGKTRLALSVAAAELACFPDGVWLVDLAPITDARLVPQTVAQMLGIPEGPHKRPPIERLAEGLRDRQLLLVLDNCEHLVEICARLMYGLLHVCPCVRVLATSREALQIEGETVWRVPALSYPDSRRPPPLAELERYHSVTLFLQRAVAVRPDFRLTERNAAALIDLCSRLDGMPLALELAAARLNSLTVEQIADRLDDRFRLLTNGRRAALPRHQTLRATLEWSHILLSAPEQVLFRRLAVFAGGWTLEAAEAVCMDSVLPTSNVLGALDGLINKSLVIAEERAGVQRYLMLETIRQYAVERLEDAGEVSELRQRHRTWVTGLVERTAPEAYDAATLAVLDQEQDNLRAALRSALEAGDADAALRLSSNWLFWYMRGHYTEGRVWITEALALPAAQARTVLRGRATCAVGYLAYLQGDLEIAESLLEDARGIALELGDDGLQAVALHQLGNVAKVRGDLARAVALVAEALRLNRQLGNRAWEAMHLVVLTELKLEMGAHEEAQGLAQTCLRLARELGHTWSTARSLHYLGRLAADVSDAKAARVLLEESLAVQRELGNQQGLASTLASLGNNALSQRHTGEAGQHFGEALRVSRDIGERVNVATCLSGMAVLAAETDPILAVRLASAAAGVWDVLGARPYPEHRSQLDRLLRTLRACMDDVAFADAEGAGRSLALDEAIVIALSVADGCAKRASAGERAAHTTAGDPLTRREREVARLIARGLSNREIARLLVIGEGTAGNHVQHILEKLCFHTRAQIASWATAHGLHPGQLTGL